MRFDKASLREYWDSVVLWCHGDKKKNDPGQGGKESEPAPAAHAGNAAVGEEHKGGVKAGKEESKRVDRSRGA